jgi:hypothetical protein
MTTNIWIKIISGGQPTQISCEPNDNIDTLKRKTKEQLSSKFERVDRDEIFIKDADGAIIGPSVLVLSFGLTGLGSSDLNPFLVDAPKLSTPTTTPLLETGNFTIPLLSIVFNMI